MAPFHPLFHPRPRHSKAWDDISTWEDRMTAKMDHAATVLEASIIGERPIEGLLDMAGDCIASGEPEKLHDIDIAINGRFVELMRKGGRDDVAAVLHALLALLDSGMGDALKRSPASERYYHRWEHLHDLCGYALENYDPDFTDRFLKSRKHGLPLMRILRKEPAGVRAKDLAGKLGVSPQYLAKLLREFEKEDLVTRRKTKGAAIVRLGFLGMAYMAETETPEETFEEPPVEGKFQPRLPWANDKNMSGKNLMMGDIGHHA